MSVEHKLKRKAKGERPYFFDDPNIDRVVSMLMGLAGEVSVIRDRLDSIERLLEDKQILPRSEIENYEPTSTVTAERAAWRETFLDEVLRIVQVDLEATETDDTQPYEEAIAAVENDSQLERRTGRPPTNSFK